MTYYVGRDSQPYGAGMYPNMYEQPSASDPFAGASAPPASPPRYASQASAPAYPSRATAPGWDDCSICLESCGDHPEGDNAKAKVVAKTDCNHFFHNFCLQNHLRTGVNNNCPNCRHPLLDRNITKINLDAPEVPAAPVQPGNQAETNNGSMVYDILSGIGKATWLAGATLLGVGVVATKVVGGAILNAASDFVWPKEIDPESVKIINREVDRIHNEITKKVQAQQEAMRVLLGQVASIGQDRSKNPVAILEQVKSLQAKVAKNAEAYLRQTEALVKDMQKISVGF